LAAASGLPLVGDDNNPALRRPYGVGQLMLDALGRRCEKLIIGLGGSATNDGGIGLRSLGVNSWMLPGKVILLTGGD
jgi:glycerate kinase